MSDGATWRQVDAAIDAGEIVELTRRMVAVPSYRADEGWESGVARVLEEFLGGDGIATTRQPVLDGRENLIATLPGRAAGRPLLMLNGHMDTVPPSGSMPYPPFAAEIHEGRVWGRGAVDMKGAVAAMAGAL
ncbi:MAG TPA: M20/M25/M40 family metallo-hydrolase, partial [bacterium]|nr:M20/M25/M40 family metallo-hydrolase [bacterium]